MNIDEWFKTIRESYASQMQCGKGCTACCHGLFDISLADAVEVAKGFQKLAPPVRQEVYARAAALQRVITDCVPKFPQPALFEENDPRIDDIVDTAINPPCPCLGEMGECLIYEHRPLSCRLEGVPMVDVHDGLFGDWCELNFKQGVPQSALAELKQNYDHIDTLEEQRSRIVATQANLSDCRLVTFIPCVIFECETFWNGI